VLIKWRRKRCLRHTERLCRWPLKGSSLRFETAATYSMRHGLAADAASQKMRAALDKGREALIAAQAERARLWQVEELRKTHELKHTLRPRGPRLGM
jgi:hypothetical protein